MIKIDVIIIIQYVPLNFNDYVKIASRENTFKLLYTVKFSRGLCFTVFVDYSYMYQCHLTK